MSSIYYQVIEHFSLKPHKNSECLTSPWFSDKSSEPKDWQIHIYPAGWGEEHKDYLSLFLFLKETEPSEITVRFKLSLLNSKNKVLAKYGPFSERLGLVTNVAVGGNSKMLKLSDLYSEKKKLLPNDELRIVCEIVYESQEMTVSSSPSEVLPFTSTVNGNMTDHYKQLMESKSLSDITIDVKGQKFEAHKLVLAARSPVFLAMFQNDLMEKKTNTLDIEDIEPTVFAEVLRFIYTDEVNKLDELAKELLAAADKYMLDLLKVKCERSLARTITLKNCCELLILTNLHSAENLKKVLLDFVCAQSSEVAVSPNWLRLIETDAHPQLLRDISMVIVQFQKL